MGPSRTDSATVRPARAFSGGLGCQEKNNLARCGLKSVRFRCTALLYCGGHHSVIAAVQSLPWVPVTVFEPEVNNETYGRDNGRNPIEVETNGNCRYFVGQSWWEMNAKRERTSTVTSRERPALFDYSRGRLTGRTGGNVMTDEVMGDDDYLDYVLLRRWGWKCWFMGWHRCLWLSVGLEWRCPMIHVIIFGYAISYGSQLAEVPGSTTTYPAEKSDNAEGKLT